MYKEKFKDKNGLYRNLTQEETTLYRDDLKKLAIELLSLIEEESIVDVSKEVNIIWDIACTLMGAFSSDEYRKVILPMFVIRRFEQTLEVTKNDVIKKYEDDPLLPEITFKNIAGKNYYNTSKFSLKELLNDPDSLCENFKDYINSFSSNIKEILLNFKFESTIEDMEKGEKLYSIVRNFSELDFSPETMPDTKMGYVYEELVRKFSENKKAGEHYTSRDYVKVMATKLMITDVMSGHLEFLNPNKVITVLDCAAGTGGLLYAVENVIKQVNPTADIRLFAQEINPESYAICRSEMLIKGKDDSNVYLGDTLKKDAFPDLTAHYFCINPPFGEAWGGKKASPGVETAVREECESGNGRFVELPAVDDMQMLFLQMGVSKTHPMGNAVIVQNGSSLFSGDTSSGESQARKHLICEDIIDCLIMVTDKVFYNTPLPTYLYCLNPNKPEYRKNKIQIINATNLYIPLSKSLGKKQKFITKQNMVDIMTEYINFEESPISKIFDKEEFLFRECVVKQPLQKNYSLNEERIQKVIESFESDESKLFKNNPTLLCTIKEILLNNIDNKIFLSISEFKQVLDNIFKDLDKKLYKAISEKMLKLLSETDKTAEIQTDKDGNVLYDEETKDIEIIPYKMSCEEYMEKEVLPYVPDAKLFFEESVAVNKKIVSKIGAKIITSDYFPKKEETKTTNQLLIDFSCYNETITEKINDLLKED